jgi:hypothetical protein
MHGHHRHTHPGPLFEQEPPHCLLFKALAPAEGCVGSREPVSAGESAVLKF